MASPAQLLANRANALKSTGPRTSEGKDASRRNALKHGLAAEALILPDEEGDVVAARMLAWAPKLDPRDEEDCWLVEQVALASVRIDRCQARELALRRRQARRAAARWDEDRRVEAETLGATLGKAKSPSLVLSRLYATKQGCDWLVIRWLSLQAALGDAGDWDEAQTALAMDLLGTPREFRSATTKFADKGRLVGEHLAMLRSQRTGVMKELDDLDRARRRGRPGPGRGQGHPPGPALRDGVPPADGAGAEAAPRRQAPPRGRPRAAVSSPRRGREARARAGPPRDPDAPDARALAAPHGAGEPSSPPGAARPPPQARLIGSPPDGRISDELRPTSHVGASPPAPRADFGRFPPRMGPFSAAHGPHRRVRNHRSRRLGAEGRGCAERSQGPGGLARNEANFRGRA